MEVKGVLSGKSTGVMHNILIMQQEDKWQLWSIVLGGSLNLLVEEVIKAQLVRVFTEYLITLGHLLRTNRLRAYNL